MNTHEKPMMLFPQKITPLIKEQLSEPAIAKQFIKQEESSKENLPRFEYDAVADNEHLVHKGIIRKYHNRILLIANSHCAVHCRYCFRQHFDYQQQTFDPKDTSVLINYLDEHPEIDEVILSGGDPLMLNNTRLAELLDCLDQRASVKRIRIHSRVLSVLPERLNNGLLDVLKKYQHKLIIVMHINHASEVLPEVVEAIPAVRALGIPLLNQSVLLRGVNDNAKALRELSEGTFALGIMPYYLNLLDQVKGAEQFYVPDNEARVIYRELAKSTSGYLVPKLVRDEGDDYFKRIIGLA